MFRFTLILVAAAAGALLLYGLGRVVLVLVMARFFAYLIAPLVAAAERPLRAAGTPRRLSRGVAIGLVYVAVSGVTWAGAALLLPTVSEQVDRVSERQSDIGLRLSLTEIRQYELDESEHWVGKIFECI